MVLLAELGELTMVCRMNSRPNEPRREGNMTQYTGLQSLLNATLGEYQSKGFRLMEDSDHFLRLYYQDSLLEVFNQTRVTIPVIHETCRRYLESLDAR